MAGGRNLLDWRSRDLSVESRRETSYWGERTETAVPGPDLEVRAFQAPGSLFLEADYGMGGVSGRVRRGAEGRGCPKTLEETEASCAG